MTRTLLSLLAVLLCTASKGQLLTYEDTQDIEAASKIKNGMDFTSYKTKSGATINVGDTLTIGKPSTNSNSFNYVFFGKLTIGSALMSNPINLADTYMGETVTIERIYPYHTKMTRKSIMGVFVHVVNPHVADMAKNRTIADYEKAVTFSEVINPNAPLTREEAISILKETKDLLDLGVINQAKYDSVKTQLAPIITN